MSDIDWNGPLEAYHTDGRVVACRVEDPAESADPRIGVRFDDGNYCLFNERGFVVVGEPGWCIRNRATTPPIDPALVERMVALVRKVAVSDLDRTLPEARAIVAALEPVDPDRAEAERLVAEWDSAVPANADFAMACLKRGRELAKEQAK